MCGRFSRKEQLAQIVSRFRALQILDDGPFANLPRYNIAPSHSAPVVVSDGDVPTIRPLRWGLVPAWEARARIGQMINARAETLIEKPSFRRLLFTRRCVVPATGFYEWAKEGKTRIPMHFRLRTGEMFGFAGLWDRWMPPKGLPLETFTILTTVPNALLAPIHDRMPVILRREDENRWLDPELSDEALLMPMLRPYPAAEMDGYEVSRAVNSPLNDAPECVRPVTAATPRQRQLI
jgi:putative SOS response-associated peptidase YedK